MTEILDILTTVANGIDWEQTTLGAVASTLLGGLAWLARKVFARTPMSDLAKRIMKNIDNPGDYDLVHRRIDFQGGCVVVPTSKKQDGFVYVSDKHGHMQSADEHLTASEKKAITSLARLKLAEFSAEKREERREAALKALRDK